MLEKKLPPLTWVNLEIAWACLSIAHPVAAQIAPDATLPINSIVTPQENTYLIEGGTQAGGNLFHSFSQFSLPTGTEAFFNNPVDIQNIFSRVTGNSISNIDGLIRANGVANLFLINPNGIIFGPNARLNIGGSFLASVANSIKFGNGIEFSASNPNPSSLLTISTPVGLQYTSQTPGPIAVQGSNLEVKTGNTLALVGGNVTISGNNNLQTAELVAGGIPILTTAENSIPTTAGGRIELGSVTGGDVTLTPTDRGFALDYSATKNFGDIQLNSGATLDTSGTSGGEIQVQARQFQLSGGSRMVSFTSGSLPGGDIAINASESVQVTGDGSFVENLDRIRSFKFTPAELGNGLFALTFGQGDAGNILINTSRFTARNGAFILASTFAAGKGGSVNVNATDSVQLDNSGLISSNLPTSTGAVGDITINTRSLTFQNLGVAIATTRAIGAGGNITINASEQAEFIGFKLVPLPITGVSVNTGLISSSLADGDAGNIIVKTQRLVLLDGALMGAVVYGGGNGGNIIIDASESFEAISNNLFLSGMSSGAVGNATGNSGNITIRTGRLLVGIRSGVLTNTFGPGNGGNLEIEASQGILLIGRSNDPTREDEISGFYANVSPSSTGSAGNITITTPFLEVRDGAVILANSLGKGTGGLVNINAGSILLDNQASLSADTRGIKNDPNREQATINLRSQNLILRRNSRITTNAQGVNVLGGNININTDTIVALENSDISANSENFRGGQVNINAQAIFGTQYRTERSLESDITATGGTPDLSGTVQINTPDVQPASGLVELTANFSDISDRIATACPATKGNSFIITGRGGLPSDPTQPLIGSNVWRDVRPVTAGNRTSFSQSGIGNPRSATPIIEAQGWAIDSQGKVVLVAEVINSGSDSLNFRSTSCQRP